MAEKMNVLLIGCGNIGYALLETLVCTDVADRIIVVQPSMSHANDFVQHESVVFVKSMEDVSKNFSTDVIILAIKPQIAEDVIPQLRSYTEKTILISMLASIKLNKLQNLTSNMSRIVRIMPTVAIKTRQSVNLAFASDNFDDDNVNILGKIMEPSGKIIWMSQEDHLDLLTPISGSGPAYFFLLAEILTEEAMKLDISKEIAQDIVRRVLVGSASLVGDADFSLLKKSVTSKGGVTEAALGAMSSGMRSLLAESLRIGIARMRELQK